MERKQHKHDQITTESIDQHQFFQQEDDSFVCQVYKSMSNSIL